MRVDPADGSVTGSVRATPGGGTSKVDARLSDMRALAAVLRTVQGDAAHGASKSLSIEWALPLAGDALSPGTALTCTTASSKLALGLQGAAWRAQLLGTALGATVDTYELAEQSARNYVQRAIATYSLTVALSRIVISPITGKEPPPDTAAVIIGDIIAIIDAELPGTYEEAMGGTAFVASGIVRPDPVTTSLVAGPGSPGAPAPARTVGEAMGRITNDLYPSGDDAAHVQVQRIVDPATGQGHWVAMVPGTATFALNAKTPLDGTGNVIAASGGVSGGEQAVSAALRDAMKKEGVLGQGEPVMLIGHSQGGMVMTNLARRRTDGLNVTHVVTYGSPVGASRVPDGVRALNIENRSDLVPRLDGNATGDGDPRRVRLVIDDPTSTITKDGATNVIEAHGHEAYRWDYEAVMDQERGRPGPPSPAVAFESSTASFFAGDAHTYRYDATRAPSAAATHHAASPLMTCTSEAKHAPAPRPSFGLGPNDQYRVTSP